MDGREKMEVVSILDTARRLITEGNPSLALQAVVTALKMTAGEQAVGPTLTRAHEVYQSQAKAAAAANDLCTLFAECAIAEASTSISHSQQPSSSMVAAAADEMMMMEEDKEPMQMRMMPMPILAESGRTEVLMEASSDGSSFICLQCGGIVSSSRRDEHLAFWCTQAPP